MEVGSDLSRCPPQNQTARTGDFCDGRRAGVRSGAAAESGRRVELQHPRRAFRASRPSLILAVICELYAFCASLAVQHHLVVAIFAH